MNLRNYIKLDKDYKKNLEYYYPRNLCIGAVAMFLFCVFVIAGALKMMDKSFVFHIYIVSFLVATSLYFWPFIQVRENFLTVSIFKKFNNVPINKKLFIRAKFVLLIRFSVLFYIPVQVMHFIGLKRTETPFLSITGFWPLAAMLIGFIFQYICMKIRIRDFNEN